MSAPLLRPTLDDLLAAHAAGNLPRPLALAVATHLALSPSSRRQYRIHEAIGGALLERIAPAALAPGAWDRLAALLDQDVGGARTAASSPPPRDGDPALRLPRPLRDYLPGPVESLPWRARTSSVREARLELGTPDFETTLVHVPAKGSYPGHAPHEIDLSLTLEGGSWGEAGHFLRGDLIIMEPDDSRVRTADEGPDWLWLRVLGAP